MEQEGVSDATVTPVVQDSEKSKQDEKTKKDTVSYETYQRTLRQLKKAKEKEELLEGKLDSFETEKKQLEDQKREAEENKLQEKGEFKKLLELKQKELEQISIRLNTTEEEKKQADKTITDTFKLHAFYEKLPGKIKRHEYLDFVDIDNIVINPETNEVEAASVESVVNSFMEKHPELVDTSHVGKLPAGHPQAIKNLDYENWKGLSAADMKKNLKIIMEKRLQKLKG